MKFLRTTSLIVLAAALGVGMFAGDAEAAFLDSVRVVTPDSGGVRGIDSLITARAYFWTDATVLDSVVQVYFWVANKADMKAVLIDSTGARTAAEDSLYAVFSVGPSPSVAFPTGRNFLAARAFIEVARNGNFTASDADTITFAPGPSLGGAGRGYVATMKLPVPESKVGEVSDLAVWAAVYDPAAIGSQSAPRGWSAAVLAKSGHWFRVDGIRPLADPNKVALDAVTALGPLTRYVRTTTPDATVRLLRAGDTLQVAYNLGTAFQDIFGLGLRVSSQLQYPTGTVTIDLGSIRRRVDTVYVRIPERLFGGRDVAPTDSTGKVALFLTDTAGNLSNIIAGGPAQGLTKSANFLIDAGLPVLTAATGDTIYPADNDTITDGGINTGETLDDLRPARYKLQESLAQLVVTFDSDDNAKDRTVTLKSPNAGSLADPFQFAAGGLAMGQWQYLNFTKDNDSTMVDVLNAANAPQAVITSNVAPILTGRYTLKFRGTDFAGNLGPERAITNVYVDVDNITFKDLFPTKLAFGPVAEVRTDTIEEVTSVVSFQLSEPADSVVIRYAKVSGPDPAAVRTRRLAGSELTRTDVVQSFTVDSLVNKTQYALSILARDLAGNYTVVGPDTFLYDTSFVVPLIKRFAVTANPARIGRPAAQHNVAGDTLILTVTADATLDGTRDAVTYKRPAIIKVQKVAAGGMTGVTLTGSGVTDLGGGRARLDADGWLAGKRTLTLKNTTSVDTLRVTVVDSVTVSGPYYTGVMDSLIVFDPAAYTKILVSAPEAVAQGQAFTVNVTLADQFGNQRVLDNRYINVGVNKVGVEVPGGPVYVAGGAGSFMAKSASWMGTGLVFRVHDMVDANGLGTIRDGVSGAVAVTSGAAVAVDAPDTLAAKDYMGANGQGDQGGFVMLTWDLSDDHARLSGYRIYREIWVNERAGGVGEPPIVALEEPVQDWIAWGEVDAIPAESIGRAVVATLDNIATRWAIAAEMAGSTSAIAKEAFDGVQGVGSAYELMASTMVESKLAAQQLVDGPQFATLTPQALAFVESGIVPQLKTVDTVVLQSARTATVEAVAAVDNIAPEPVAGVRAVDTPADNGGSVTVTWTRSVSDALVSRNVPNSVGLLLGDSVPGVVGYGVYRQAGNGEAVLVGRADAGQTSFVDETAVNGVRYTYLVRAYDQDNESVSSVKSSAMAIRNNAVDEAGVRIFGLFGADHTVGFDDFFFFADHFGLTGADQGFEPAFDLVADAKIDFEDFFLFADNFGRTARVVAGKVVPALAGLNTDARLYLEAGAELPAIGDEVVLTVDLANFAEVKGYGLNVSFDGQVLEFVRAASESNLLGSGELAAPQVISQSTGEVAIAGYGDVATEGSLGLNLVFRTKTEIENSFVEVTAGEIRDGSYGVNTVALPAAVQIQTRPESYALANNYPNPFNPATTIKYALPEAALVRLEVYNVVGQVVRTLVAQPQTAGRYVVQWDATNDHGQSLSSGIYFYRLQAGSQFLEVKKMLLLK
jgi:hypothetical protein